MPVYFRDTRLADRPVRIAVIVASNVVLVAAGAPTDLGREVARLLTEGTDR